MLEVSGELRMMLYLVLCKTKDSLHTSDSQRVGEKTCHDKLCSSGTKGYWYWAVQDHTEILWKGWMVDLGSL